MFTLRRSPGSGGGAGGADSAVSIAIPVFHRITIRSRPKPTHTTLPTEMANITESTYRLSPGAVGSPRECSRSRALRPANMQEFAEVSGVGRSGAAFDDDRIGHTAAFRHHLEAVPAT